MDRTTEIAVVGATGVVGREVLGALLQREVPADRLTLLGSERSAGEEVEYGPESLEVEALGAEAFRGKHVVILATPDDSSRSLAAKAQAAGAWVVDLSNAFKGDKNVPLILPGVNSEALEQPFQGRVVTTPSAIPTALALMLKPLSSLGVQRLHVTALMGASHVGQRGIRELEKHTADLLSGRENEPEVFPHRLALNFIPQVGAFGEGTESSEEAGWSAQLQRLFGARAPTVSGLAIQVPTFYGHGLSVLLEGQGLNADGVRNALRGKETVKVLDEPKERVYPMPMLVTADEAVHAGRISDVPGKPGAVQLFAAVDNAGRGAAVGAVELALLLADRR